MDKQKCLEWMYDEYKHFCLLPETYALSILLFNTCYDKIKQPLQLMTVCLHIAAKYEEISPPSIKTWVSKDSLPTYHSMELDVLSHVGFCISALSRQHAIAKLNELCILRDDKYITAKNLICRALKDKDCACFSQETIAIAAWQVSNKNIKPRFDACAKSLIHLLPEHLQDIDFYVQKRCASV